MTAGNRFLASLATILLAATGLVAGGTLPAAAHNQGTINYAALGDSYAAGQGAGAYRNDCLQSTNGYPALLDAVKRVKLRRNLSCTGATTQDVIDGQLSALNPGIRLVTLTVGANDLRVGDVAAACSLGPVAACQAAIEGARALLAAPPGGVSVLAARLASTYASVAAAAPKALILVTGYPYLFKTPAEDNPNSSTIVAINDATTALNATVDEVVRTLQAAGVNIEYVDVTEAFDRHEIGSAVPFINSTGADAFHPNAAGYIAYAAALEAALPTKHALRHR